MENEDSSVENDDFCNRGCIKPEFKAGDMLILPEATLHGVVPWRAEGRTRRCVFRSRFFTRK